MHVSRRDDDYDAHNDDDPTRTTDDGDKVVHPGAQLRQPQTRLPQTGHRNRSKILAHRAAPRATRGTDDDQDDGRLRQGATPWRTAKKLIRKVSGPTVVFVFLQPGRAPEDSSSRDFVVRSSFGGAKVEEIRKASEPTVVFAFLRPGTRGFVGKRFWRSKLFRLSFGRGSAKS